MRESGLLIDFIQLPLSKSSSHPSSAAFFSATTGHTPAVFVVPGTLFPHSLLDQIMPTLSGTQWQLLCVIIRQTQGWFDPQTGGRKTRDWLSHSQLRRRTGRGSDAICHAIDTLVRQELIEVCDKQGQVLATAQQRQRSYSRLFYSLTPQVLALFQSASLSQTDPPTSVLPSRKAETTKENGTKKRPKKPFGKTESKQAHHSDSPFAAKRSHKKERTGSDGHPNQNQCDCLALASPPSSSASSAVSAPDPKLLRFIEIFHDQHRKRFDGTGEPVTNTLSTNSLNACEQARLQMAIERYGFEPLLRLLEVFWGSDVFYTRKHGHSLSVFLDMLHILPTLRSKPPSA